MEIIIAIVVVAIGAIWYFNRDKGLDVNSDGKVDIQDVKAAVENTVAVVKEEVKEEVAEVKAAVKKTATRAKTATKTATKKVTTKKASTTGAKRGPKPKTGV
jgi:cytochrome c biogenesis factor